MLAALSDIFTKPILILRLRIKPAQSQKGGPSTASPLPAHLGDPGIKSQGKLDELPQPSTSWFANSICGSIIISLSMFVVIVGLSCVSAGLVEIPFSLAEGLRNMPTIWGESIPLDCHIQNASDGLLFAGRYFVVGTIDAFKGLFARPYAGRHGGPLGVLLGVLQGWIGFIAKMGAGM